MKSLQGTIKILMKSDFSSDLPLLTIIGGSAQHWGAQPMIGGGGLGHSKSDIKLRPCKQGEVGEQKSKLTFS